MIKNIDRWMKVYYPIPAVEAAKGSMLDAVKHSLKKWSGLTNDILNKYGLSADIGFVGNKRNRYAFWVDDTSCALCAKYLMRTGSCSSCPLSIVRGGVQCDHERDDESRSPYSAFTVDNNPRPMIKWLKKAKAYAEKKEKK